MRVPDQIHELVFETPFFFLTCSSWMWMFQFDEIVSFKGGHLRHLVVHVGLFQKTTTCILMFFVCFDYYNNYIGDHHMRKKKTASQISQPACTLAQRSPGA